MMSDPTEDDLFAHYQAGLLTLDQWAQVANHLYPPTTPSVLYLPPLWWLDIVEWREARAGQQMAMAA